MHLNPLGAHMTGQCLVLPDSRGLRTAPDGPRSAMKHRTMGFGAAGVIMAFHHSLKPFAFRNADHIYPIALLKHIDLDDLSDRDIPRLEEFTQMTTWCDLM